MPAPANAVAATALGHDRVAVLAGTGDTKGIFIVDAQTGSVYRSFGVTKEATGVTAEGADGPLLLSIGNESGDAHFGAVEEWSLSGIKRRVAPLPTTALGITAVAKHRAYVLLAGDGVARAAAVLRLPSLRVGKAIPLEAGARSLQQCVTQRGDFLIYTDGVQGHLKLRSIATGEEASTAFAAGGAVCSSDRDIVYAIVGSTLNHTVSALNIPALVALSSTPASSDAIALYETRDRHLFALNSSPAAATIETFRDDTVAVAR